jgi:carboxylesterase
MLPSAAPFFEKHGPVGVLMIHGYSGSPAELRPMGIALARAGYSVHGPLLAGHGERPDALHGIVWQAWATSAEAGLRRLQARCATVFVCGFSMGALLALRIAARQEVAGVIALAPALRFYGGLQMRLTGIVKHVMPWFYPLEKADFANPMVRAGVLERMPDADLDDQDFVARLRREVRIPLSSIHELVQLRDAVERDLSRVTAPVLLMQGRNDTTVEPRSVDEVAQRICSRDQRTIWFEHSGHMLPNDVEREAVWAAAVEWMKERSERSV